ncbi:MAG: prephenate dehydratase domain-containing protein [bacterium]|nr:prephenate dehydratase domain-containing protein [bacterium]
MADIPIENPRAEIDGIDREILRLLNRRAEIALRVGAVKAGNDASLVDPLRESQVIERLTRENPGPFDSTGIENIFQRIIDESLALQQSRYHRTPTNDPANAVPSVADSATVGFLGDPGSFSETAAIGILGRKCEYTSFPTFESLYHAIDVNDTDYIISPLENSLVGSIQRCYDLLAGSSLSIVAEIILPVSHFLIAPPIASMETITTVESHPAALSQCERFFAGHPDLKRIAGDDTAGSVRRAVESDDATRAAIGGRRAATIYGGKILREHIEDHADNFTRFALLSKNPSDTADGSKISLILRLKNEPGSLHNSLRPFVRRNIDLTKIESRPIKGQPAEFNFYLDLQAPASNSDLRGALDEVREQAASVRYLGRYPTIVLTHEQINAIS